MTRQGAKNVALLYSGDREIWLLTCDWLEKQVAVCGHMSVRGLPKETAWIHLERVSQRASGYLIYAEHIQ